VLIRVSNRTVVTAVMSETISNSSERTDGPNRTVGVGRLQTHEHMEVHACWRARLPDFLPFRYL